MSLALTAAATQASTLTSTSCGSAGAPYIANSTGCSAIGSYGAAYAGVSTSVYLPTLQSDAAIIQADSTVSGFEGTIRGLTATSNASSSASIGINFDTHGPTRLGFLEVIFNQTAFSRPTDGYLYESLAVGSENPVLTGADQTFWIPIQLGADFGFEYQESITAIASAYTGFTSGEVGADISLQAFESDATTSVQLFDPPGNPVFTPEPATLGMMAAALGGFALFLRARR